MTAPQPDDPISVREAVLAMRMFLFRFWQEISRPHDGLAEVLSETKMGRGEQEGDEPRTADPAMWSDWINAVQEALLGTQPEDVMDRPRA